jgi:hypothetical protein
MEMHFVVMANVFVCCPYLKEARFELYVRGRVVR